ncbi:unnamed protein product, partial [Pylaiella littoralis]
TAEPSHGLRETRDIIIRNSCSFDLSLGFTGGFAGFASDGACQKNQVDGGNGRCFWDLDLADSLEPGDVFETTIDHGGEDGPVLLSGNVWGTRFLEEVCPDAECTPWIGPRGSVTRVEFTFLTGENSADFIDVSLVDGGASLPVSMRPRGFELEISEEVVLAYPGHCGWDFDPGDDFVYLVEVRGSQGECASREECLGGDVCGVSFAGPEPVYGTCGQHAGWTNALANCMHGSTSPKFQCDKYFDVYACRGEWDESGYAPGVSVSGETRVCGCTTFPGIEGLSLAFPCQNSDEVWIDVALPWITFLKNGCPSAFTWPYDDSASSLFTFSSGSYELELCPGDSESVFFM